jgi:hypothetical protein
MLCAMLSTLGSLAILASLVTHVSRHLKQQRS